MRDIPTPSPTQQKLQKAVYQQASSFLHLHMLPLKTLPKIPKHATTHGGKSLPNWSLPNGKSALASIRYASNHDHDSNSVPSTQSSQISDLEAEEKALKDQLIVLEEQKFLLQEQVADANKRRKFDEVAALAAGVEDLTREIDRVQGLLAGLDFKGAYIRAGLGSGTASPALESGKGKGVG